MRRLFYGNFDFEHQLAAGNAPVVTNATLRRINAELATVWLAIAEEGDCIWAPEGIDPAFLSEMTRLGLPAVNVLTESVPDALSIRDTGAMTLCPWGWSSAMLELGQRLGLHCHAPPMTAVREANDRLFSFGLESEWQVGLDGAAIIHLVEDLHRSIAGFAANERWVLKARFGMSARERILGRGKELPPATVNWLQNRLARDKSVVFEPWVENIAEAGIQIEIPVDGTPALIGVTPLMTDELGTYRGSAIGRGETASEWGDAVEVGLRTADRVQRLGYFGPLGIDAMKYRDDKGTMRVRPLQDINVRYTMGRIALGWRRLLRDDEFAVWLHFPVTQKPGFLEKPGFSRVISTSLATIGGKTAQHGSALVIGSDPPAF